METVFSALRCLRCPYLLAWSTELLKRRDLTPPQRGVLHRLHRLCFCRRFKVSSLRVSCRINVYFHLLVDIRFRAVGFFFIHFSLGDSGHTRRNRRRRTILRSRRMVLNISISSNESFEQNEIVWYNSKRIPIVIQAIIASFINGGARWKCYVLDKTSRYLHQARICRLPGKPLFCAIYMRSLNND